MKKLLVSLFILTLLCIVLLPFGNAEAWPGCCSHHGGVCGCHCCDGTSLSATCAPHYPQCQAKDDLIKKEVENSKSDYYKNHQWFRERLITKLMDSLKADIDSVAFYVYTMLPDVK